MALEIIETGYCEKLQANCPSREQVVDHRNELQIKLSEIQRLKSSKGHQYRRVISLGFIVHPKDPLQTSVERHETEIAEYDRILSLHCLSECIVEAALEVSDVPLSLHESLGSLDG